MMTRIIHADDEQGLKQAAEGLRSGQLVAFPTETVYGLGADALNTVAVKRVFEAKGRPSDNPLIVHIAEFSQLSELVREIPPQARVLMEAFWPGPLTLVFKKSPRVPDAITAGLDTVAIRMPQNPMALRLIREARVSVAAPSANRSGRPSPTTASHVAEDLNGRIEYIIDGGPCTVGVESTVLDITVPVPMILRPGGVTREMLEAVIGPIAADTVLEVSKDQKPRSPGMKYRHYSPRAELVIVRGETGKVTEKINALVREKQEQGLKAGVLTCAENRERYNAPVVIPAGSIKEPSSLAAGLYQALRGFDETDVDIIYSEAFQEEGIGQAVMNRLKKAASGKIIDI